MHSILCLQIMQHIQTQILPVSTHSSNQFFEMRSLIFHPCSMDTSLVKVLARYKIASIPWPMGDMDAIMNVILNLVLLNAAIWVSLFTTSSNLLITMPSDECQVAFLMLSQHWSGWWLEARQTTSHYPSQYWHSFKSPYGVTRLQSGMNNNVYFHYGLGTHQPLI